MKPIRRCDWLPERARWSDTARSKRVHESFLSQNIFRDNKKIFCDFSVGIELENEKTGTCDHFRIRLGSFSVLENKVWSSFFQCSLCDIKWLDIGLVVFLRSLWISTSSRCIKTHKENLANIQPSWPRAWSIWLRDVLSRSIQFSRQTNYEGLSPP